VMIRRQLKRRAVLAFFQKLSPCLVGMRAAVLPSLFLPPLECCLGTNPIQAEKLRPDRKAFGSATVATRAVASPDRRRALHQASCSSHWNGARP
jgi:hypothetical protein